MGKASRIMEGLERLAQEGRILAYVRFPGEPDRYLVNIRDEPEVYLTSGEAEALLVGASLEPPVD